MYCPQARLGTNQVRSFVRRNFRPPPPVRPLRLVKPVEPEIDPLDQVMEGVAQQYANYSHLASLKSGHVMQDDKRGVLNIKNFLMAYGAIAERRRAYPCRDAVKMDILLQLKVYAQNRRGRRRPITRYELEHEARRHIKYIERLILEMTLNGVLVERPPKANHHHAALEIQDQPEDAKRLKLREVFYFVMGRERVTVLSYLPGRPTEPLFVTLSHLKYSAYRLEDGAKSAEAAAAPKPQKGRRKEKQKSRFIYIPTRSILSIQTEAEFRRWSRNRRPKPERKDSKGYVNNRGLLN